MASRWLTAVMVGGAALLTLGLLLGYQSWSNRSAPPIDDQLPFLEVDELAAAGDASSPTTAQTTSGAEPESSTGAVGAMDTPPDPAAEVVVHVAGAVAQPGVVSLPAGSRVYQAIEQTGGATRDADLDRVNLAAPVIDGERIHVPEIGEEVVPALLQPPASDSGLSTVPSPVDVNTADVTELEALRGIGPSLAQAIITTRVQRGPFRSLDELLEVPGIGEAKLAQLADQVTVT